MVNYRNRFSFVAQKVMAAGYACKDNLVSTVFGFMLEVSLGVLMTNCKIRAGFSGGPIFSTEGQLLGLTIGMLSSGSVNFGLSFTEFGNIIKDFIKNNGVLLLISF